MLDVEIRNCLQQGSRTPPRRSLRYMEQVFQQCRANANSVRIVDLGGSAQVIPPEHRPIFSAEIRKYLRQLERTVVFNAGVATIALMTLTFVAIDLTLFYLYGRSVLHPWLGIFVGIASGFSIAVACFAAATARSYIRTVMRTANRESRWISSEKSFKQSRRQ